MRVRNWMTKVVVTVSGATRVREASDLMKTHKIRHLPVVEEGRLVGIISDRDLREVVPSQVATSKIETVQHFLDKIQVQLVMTKQVVGISPDGSLAKAADLMVRNKIGCLPVLDGYALVGIITGSDILRAVAEEKGVMALPEIPPVRGKE